MRPVLMADIGIIALDDDLSSTLKLHPAEMANVRRCARRSAGIAFSGRQNFGHIAPPIKPAGDWSPAATHHRKIVEISSFGYRRRHLTNYHS